MKKKTIIIFDSCYTYIIFFFIVFYSFQITDSGIRSLVERSRCLRTLNLDACHLLTDESLSTLRSSCSLLRRLNINRCLKLSDRAIKMFECERPTVDVTY